MKPSECNIKSFLNHSPSSFFSQFFPVSLSLSLIFFYFLLFSFPFCFSISLSSSLFSKVSDIFSGVSDPLLVASPVSFLFSLSITRLTTREPVNYDLIRASLSLSFLVYFTSLLLFLFSLSFPELHHGATSHGPRATRRGEI